MNKMSLSRRYFQTSLIHKLKNGTMHTQLIHKSLMMLSKIDAALLVSEFVFKEALNPSNNELE